MIRGETCKNFIFYGENHINGINKTFRKKKSKLTEKTKKKTLTHNDNIIKYISHFPI